MPLPRPTRPRARRLLVLATVLFASLLALVPALTAADGDPPDTITVCHSTGGGEYEPDTALENDFYGTTAQGHGEHPADIVPPFVVEDPRPGDPGSFPGRNSDLVGETLLRERLRAPDLPRRGERQSSVTGSGHADENPSVTQPAHDPVRAIPSDREQRRSQGRPPRHDDEPAVPGERERNGATSSRRSSYIDENGVRQVSQGVNWTPEGQAIYENGCKSPVTPIPRRADHSRSSSASRISVTGSSWPTSGTTTRTTGPSRRRPTRTSSRREREREAADVVRQGASPGSCSRSSSAETITWSLTGNELRVPRGLKPCPGGSITVIKRLVPAADTGKFALLIDGEVKGGASAVGDGGTTGRSPSPAGRHTVSETRRARHLARGLHDRHHLRIGQHRGRPGARRLDVTVRRGAKVECTITNTAKALAQQVSPVLECVVFNDGRAGHRCLGLRQRERAPGCRPRGWDDGTAGELLHAESSDA